MVRQHLEVERKYDVPPDAVLPDELGPAARRDELLAVYWDTAQMALQRHRITLRHRSGGLDAGWHLKLPAGEARLEIEVWAEDGDSVPTELSALVRAACRGAALVPVARLATTRSVHPVLDEQGRTLVEVVDDDVLGQALLSERQLHWREWEAELVAGDRAALEAVDGRLRDARARPSASPSKVGRLLPAGPVPVPVLRRTSAAGEVLRRHLAEQRDELVERDPQVRLVAPDAVHKMRVATRRLLSALKTFRLLLDPASTSGLSGELRWLAGELGATRDAEVVRARLLDLLAEEPPGFVVGPVLDTVDRDLDRRRLAAHERVVDALDSERYLALLRALDGLVAAALPPGPAQDAARDVLPRLIRTRDRRLRKALRAADTAPDAPARDLALHEARKQAKAARYAAEAIRPPFGGAARRYAAAVTTLQEVLGDRQDSVVLRAVLLELGADSTRSGRNGFTLGRLHALEQVRSTAPGDVPAVRRRFDRPRLRAWLV